MKNKEYFKYKYSERNKHFNLGKVSLRYQYPVTISIWKHDKHVL